MENDKKISLFKALFRGREDVFPRYWENKAGKKGYNPACANNFKKGCAHLKKLPCDGCENQKLIPLTDIEIKNHFTGNQLIGIYPLLQDGMCAFLAADFDAHHSESEKKNPLQDAKNFIDVCEIYGISAYLERSKSGAGYHVWIFLKGLIPAWKVRLVIFALLREAQIIDEDNDQRSFDRLFPNQDTLSGRSFGNLIALPFYGQALKQGNSTFLNKNLQPITTDADIIVFLESIERVSELTFDQIIDEWKLTREEARQTVGYIPPDDLGSREGLKRMIIGCSFFSHCNENQKTLSEPLWYDLASNLCRFDGGQEKFHDLSNRHSNYSIKSTDQKFEHAFKASGPVTCAKIRQDGYNCPMKKGCGVESPAGLGAISKNEIEKKIADPDIVDSFPIDAMPECTRDLILQGAKSLFCPPDFLGVALLVMLGAAIGNKKSIQIKPGWIFKANIYACIIALPGSAKSPAQTVITKPIRDLQTKMLKEYQIKKMQYDIDLSKWEFDCNKNKKEMKPPKPEPPMPDEIYTSDTTLEALVEMLSNNDHGLTMIVDELTGWVNGLNQYKGGKGSDKEHYLSFWSGMTQKVNRKNKPPIVIESPFFSVVGNIPPSILGSLVDEKSKGEEGFIHRILFSYPDPVSQQWSDCYIDQKVIDNYNDLFINLYKGKKVKWDNNDSSTWDDPSTWGNESSRAANQVLSLTPEAYSFWIECYNDIQRERESPDFPENMHGPWSKMIAYFARITLIIHCIRLEDRETYSEKVDIESITMAFTLIKYFCSHAKKVYSQLSESEEDKQFRRIIAWKNKHSKKEVTAREILRAKLCKNIEEVIILFNIMQKHQIGTIGEEKVSGGKTIKFVFGV